MVIKKVLFIFLIMFFSINFSSAFEFNGTTFNQNGIALNNTLINVSIYDSSSNFAYIGSNITYSNSTGWFNLTILANGNWMYSPRLLYTNGSVVEYIGQSLPNFPSQVLQEISGTNFYLKEAGTINISAVNSTGSPMNFSYQIKDQKLGYIIVDTISSNTYVYSALVNLPRERNYSIMIFPDQSMPVSFGWTNFSSNDSYVFDGGNSKYNGTTYINVSGISGWEQFTVVPYLLEPGSMAQITYGAMPYNLSAFFDGTSDIYNLSTGITNNQGFYNISLPSTVETSDMLLFAVARNGTEYYGGFRNLSLGYDTYNSGVDYPLNFSFMFGLLGNETFNIINSSNATLTVQAHIEVDLDYTSYGVKKFTWLADVNQGSASTFSVPLLNITGINEMNIFAGGGDYAPIRKEYTVLEIVANNNITLTSFNPGDIDGDSLSSDISVAFYLSNSTCDVSLWVLFLVVEK